MRHIYLDYNATTPIAPSVQEAMQPFLTEHFGNPSSGHALGRASQEAVDDARGQLAHLLGADREEVFFTSGGTESNNLALKGVMMRGAAIGDGHVIISTIEHPAIVEPSKFLERLGFDVTVINCDRNGVVNPDTVEAALKPNTRLVSIMHANNEIGTIQPIRQIADICHAHDVLLHTDAAQSVGKIRTHVEEMGVDLLTVAGHKIYAPKGVGAIYVRRGVALEPVNHGAGHESGMRAGTENVPYIVGLGYAAMLATKGLDDAYKQLSALRDRLLMRLREAIGGRLTVNGEAAERLPNTLSVNFPDVVGHDLLARSPELCASTGAACHSGATSMSATLKAIGLTPIQASGTVRLSVGWYTSEEEVDRAASLLISAWENLST